ncbi:hypothetical protein F5878DRAFT_676722 [Lentinula raphanica]|uniref:DNA polymerase epsilon catalytic subunit n=1 Tax=Lentinula raphanica TaxID=153919 RepID=A0AA38UFG6_9AGAR|nr:hypothetical protein F5878DRAFT_676722 [Lentinula raphanica]
MVKDKRLACKFIISAKFIGAPVTECYPSGYCLCRREHKADIPSQWLKDSSVVEFDLRSILDWNYYIERLGSVIQRLITIPAAMQKVPNPIPRIHHPDWLHRRNFKQNKLTDFFKQAADGTETQEEETQLTGIEDIGESDPQTLFVPSETSMLRKGTTQLETVEEDKHLLPFRTTVKLHIVDPATRRQNITRLREAHIGLKKQRNEDFGQSKLFAYPDSREFTTSYHSTDAAAMKAISRELGIVEDQNQIVVLSSNKDDSYFEMNNPKLAEFLVLSMAKAKCAQTLDVFPWQFHVVGKMLNRYRTKRARPQFQYTPNPRTLRTRPANQNPHKFV